MTFDSVSAAARALARCHSCGHVEPVKKRHPPPTPPAVAGLRFKLIAKQAGGLGPGAVIIYKGISVGKLETRVCSFGAKFRSLDIGAIGKRHGPQIINPQQLRNDFQVTVDEILWKIGL